MSSIALLEEEIASYRWEKSQATWESVQEDAEGNLIEVATNEAAAASRRRHKRLDESIRRGLIRYFVLALDCSSSAADIDLKPCRLELIKSEVKRFIREYFDQNPISQFGVITTRDRIAETLTELSGNPKHHESKVAGLLRKEGEASLQNTLILTLNLLKNVPEYGSRECLIVFNSLKTRDPGDIFLTLEEMKRFKIRVNVICIAAELFICRKLAEETGGTFAVALDALHFAELLMMHVVPPPDLQQQQRTDSLTTEFVYMGFPRRSVVSLPVFATSDGGEQARLTNVSYICPRCHMRTTELPTQCTVCRLQLNSSSHIARSHHHLFPVKNFVEVASTSISETNTITKGDNMKEKRDSTIVAARYCFGCCVEISPDAMRWQCPSCLQQFCSDCDLFIHESLHNCPGC